MRIKIILTLVAVLLLMVSCSPFMEDKAPEKESEVVSPYPANEYFEDETVSVDASGKVTMGKSSGITYQNEDIDQALLDEIKALDDTLIAHIQKGDTQAVIGMCWESVVGEESQVDSLVQLYTKYLQDKPYAYEERYYFDMNASGGPSNAMAISAKNGYIVHSEAIDGEVFISLIKVIGTAKESLMTILYVKEAGEWKIASLYYNDYTYYGMNAVDLYEKANELSESGHDISAAIYTMVINRVLNPSRNIQYHETTEIIQYMQDVTDRITGTYSFPQRIEDPKVDIYKLGVETTVDGLMPSIAYVTTLDVADQSQDNMDAIEAEANKLHDKVMALYEGFEEDFDIYLYRAYSEAPNDPTKQYQGYGTVIRP